MKLVTKYFDTLKKAMAYQNKLHNQYDHVQLLRSPRFVEAGFYQWEISKPQVS